jgi:prevent-host-death family protein
MFSDDQPVRTVTITELDRHASAVIGWVDDGERVVVTRNGIPRALIVSISDGVEVMIAGSESFALLRREAREALESGQAGVLDRWRPRR